MDTSSTKRDGGLWPRPGHSFTYTVQFETAGAAQATARSADTLPSFELSLPRREGETEIHSAIVHRRGGPSPEDDALRAQLYAVVGQIVISAGHAEAAMKRLLLLLSGASSKLTAVDHTWTDLERKLRAAILNSADPAAEPIREALDWAARRGLKDMRDNVVHGYIWDYAPAPVTISRWKRKKPAMAIVTPMEQLATGASNMYEFARLLELPLRGRWIEAAILPHNREPEDA